MQTTDNIETAIVLPSLSDSHERQRTLLIVDDEEGPRLSLRFIFEDDYRILLAEDGPEAIELAREGTVDAAVLDIRMLKMSGIELLKRLKAMDPDIQVIMLTAYESLESVRQALHFGACEYLNKPFDTASMRAAVATAMERRAIADEIRANSQKIDKLRTEIRNQQMQLEMLRTQSEIYASVIHDINSPLTVILGFVALIDHHLARVTRMEENDVASVKDRLTQISNQVKNCIEISRRYLRFLKPTPTEKSTVAINQILSDLGHLLRVHPAARHHQLVIRSLPSDMQVQINGTELMQILLNLAINACQCSEKPHQVHVKASQLAAPLSLSQFVDGPRDLFLNRDGLRNTPPLLALSVEDDGPGIPPEAVPQVFEPFFTTKQDCQGAGLGLSIVSRLTKKAAGGIQPHTKPGAGTRFTLYLPAVVAEPISSEMAPESP
ncbi:MAG: response regulator [Candidatus Omnitrophica bacterium]|nr:response regulator [Candidatus Omnitrophota bacterium]